MNERIELNNLSNSIRQAATSWNGGMKIKIETQELTITQLVKDALAKLNKYLIIEKSLTGRVETCQNFVSALNQLQNKANLPELISLIGKVNQVQSFAVNEQKYLVSKVSQNIQQKIVNESTAYPNTLEAKITFAAFRAVKNVYPSELEFLDSLGSWQRYTLRE